MSEVQSAAGPTTLLERVIAAHQARSMHHHIVLDALNLIEAEESARWKSLFLLHHPDLLKGAKAPDAEFKDFKNHVLHVSEGLWGGAQDAAMEWYGELVGTLRAKHWSKAAYALGVLSHYYADVCQPFHTGQTEEEGAIHRAVEWSIFKSADAVKARVAEAGYPEIEAGDGIGFVAEMVLEAARASHPHYQTFIDHYNLDAGVEDPPSGVDETMLAATAEVYAYAVAGTAQLISRAVSEASVAPPKTSLTAQGYLAAAGIPLRKIVNKLSDAADRRAVEAMYAEFQKTGKVIRTLPEDDKLIRKLHARQVLRTPLKALDAQSLKPLGAKHVPVAPVEAPEEIEEAKAAPEEATETIAAPKKLTPPAKPPVLAEEAASETAEPEAAPIAEPEAEDARTGLTREDPIVDAPSIGRKTAKRLAKASLFTIGDLLDCDPEAVAEQMEARYMTPGAIADWQDQTRLMMAVPGLRVHDVQILVGAGVRSVQALAEASARDLFMDAMTFLTLPEGERVLESVEDLEEEEVEHWIDMAKTRAA